jgi:hypothetical protein
LHINVLYAFFDINYAKIIEIAFIFIIFIIFYKIALFIIASGLYFIYDFSKNPSLKIESVISIVWGILSLCFACLLLYLFYLLNKDFFLFFLVVLALNLISLVFSSEKTFIVLVYIAFILLEIYFPDFIFNFSKNILFSYTEIQLHNKTQFTGYLITKDKDFVYLFLERKKIPIAIPVKLVEKILFLKPPRLKNK